MTFDHDRKTGGVFVYDGKQTKSITFEEYQEMSKKYYSSAYKLIRKEDRLTIEETYTKYKTAADALKKETDGFVDLYKSGEKTVTALVAFERLRDEKYEPTQISAQQAIWIMNASYGALVGCEKGYKGKGYKYDFVSRYPDIMRRNDFLVPMEEGQYQTIKKYVPHGCAIYRCRIERKEDKIIHFKYNDKCDFYPSKDVRRALQLGLTVTMIDDGEPNLLYWSKEKCKTGHQIFGSYINYFFDLKEKGIPMGKDILTCLRGKLCQKDVIKVHVKRDAKKVEEIYDNRTVKSITPFVSGWMLELIKTEKPFETIWARMEPFLLSEARYELSHLMALCEPVYYHTDGLISKTKLRLKKSTSKHIPNFVLGKDMGNVRYEGECDEVKVKHVSAKPTGTFYF